LNYDGFFVLSNEFLADVGASVPLNWLFGDFERTYLSS
jgi:hypothetical protein